MHLFNKKKFEKLPERYEWDHEINLMKEAPKELNAKAYAMTLKKEEALNQWVGQTTQSRLNSGVKIWCHVFIFRRKTVYYDWFKTIGNSIRLQ